ncbi:MAG: hypothetical protein ACRDRE_03750 [Pseudonocardiaceae bacterium]
MGKVYVFNTMTKKIIFNLNGQGGDSIAEANVTNYAPTLKTYERCAGGGEPQKKEFGGTNTVQITIGAGSAVKYVVAEISYDDYPEDKNMQLYVFSRYLVLAVDNIVRKSVLSPIRGTELTEQEQKDLATSGV